MKYIASIILLGSSLFIDLVLVFNRSGQRMVKFRFGNQIVLQVDSFRIQIYKLELLICLRPTILPKMLEALI